MDDQLKRLTRERGLAAAYGNAPVATMQAVFPVLIFSHGYAPGFSRQNTVQLEALASHGYVVFSISHTHEALVSLFPDGRVIPFSPDQRRTIAADASAELESRQSGANRGTDPIERANLLAQLLTADGWARASVRIWAADIVSTLDELERIQNGQVSNPLNGRLRLDQIGVFGMSFGGAASVQACLNDSRCTAVANLDGLQYGDSFTNRIAQPYLMMYSEDNAGMNDFALESALAAAYRVSVAGSTHYNYTDFALISALFARLGFTGSIATHQMEAIMNAYLLAFFDKHVLGKETDLLALNRRFPEVALTVK
jgi:hypothetical protein